MIVEEFLRRMFCNDRADAGLVTPHGTVQARDIHSPAPRLMEAGRHRALLYNRTPPDSQ